MLSTATGLCLLGHERDKLHFGLAICGILQQFRNHDLVAAIYFINSLRMDGRPVGLFCMLSLLHLVNVVFTSELDNNIGNLQLDLKVSSILYSLFKN